MRNVILMFVAVAILSGCATLTTSEKEQYQKDKSRYLEQNKKWFSCTGKWC